MIPPSRVVAVCSVARVAACARHRRAAVTTRVVEERVDPSALRAAPVTREDSLRRAAYLRADSAAARVDTIVVTPPALRLPAGDSVALGRAVRVQARDAAGLPVEGFVPLYDVQPSGVARLRAGYVVGGAPGAAVLRIRAVRVTGGAPSTPTRPLTAVPVTVTVP
jgi:hypothetical protein